MQIPLLYNRSSDEAHLNKSEGSFLVLIYEKFTRKRSYAKSQPQFQKLKKSKIYPRHEEE